MKFHTDEHIAEAVALGLRRRGIDVTTTPQARLLGAADDVQLAYARSEGRVIVSHDPDMLRLAAAGTPHAGIAYCPHQKYNVGELISKLLMLAKRIETEKMINRVEFP